MRILFVGDVVGKPGRMLLADLAPVLRDEYDPDLLIVNAENAAGGLGITREIAEHMFDMRQADAITLGNHAFAKRDVFGYLDEDPRILRPANFPPGVPGKGMGVFNTKSGKIAVISLQGRTFMDAIDDPFRAADALLKEAGRSTAVSFIDFHAEATSEKQAFGWHVDGRASAVVGTHTHVQTADERILPGGTAYLTDAGMTGPSDSVIGMKPELVLPRFYTMMPTRFEVADGPCALSGVLIDVDAASGRATAIQRIQRS